jgi:oligosaccharide repeat unit polymerase
MVVGFIALALFFLSNASLGAIASGAFRGTTIQEGTGPYFRLSYLLMAGSVLLCSYLLTKGNKWIALVPVAISMLLYWVLGGRGRALTSLAAGLLMMWYFNREQAGWPRLRFNLRYVVLGFAGLLFVVWVSFAGSLYRGGLGVQAFSEALSLSGLVDYLNNSIFIDIGQLHSLAGAVEIGPGVLGGQTFVGSLTWPLEKFFPIAARSAGVYIIETLVGFSGQEQKWGVNASLIGDAYLNFGVTGVAIVMSLFGALLKILYLKFRQGRLHAAIYALAVISALQAFVVSIEVWPQAMITLVFAFVVIFLGNTIFRLR